MIPFSFVAAAQAELQEMELFPRKRRMSDSELLLKSADSTVKLPYEEWLRLQRMERTAAAEKKRRELIEKELEERSLEEESRRIEFIENVKRYVFVFAVAFAFVNVFVCVFFIDFVCKFFNWYEEKFGT